MCFEGLGSDSHRVFSRFVRGSREISSVSSLYRESTDSLISFMGGGEEGQKKESTFGKNETINVFSIASGHLYERFLRYIHNVYIPL